jgi:uncharacterized protein YukE
MNDLRVGEGVLLRAADMTSTAHADLTAEVNGLPARVSTSGAWEGGGAGQFTNLITAWNADTRRILQTLETFESNLRGVEVNYNDADQLQADVFRNLSTGLSGQA